MSGSDENHPSPQDSVASYLSRESVSSDFSVYSMLKENCLNCCKAFFSKFQEELPWEMYFLSFLNKDKVNQELLDFCEEHNPFKNIEIFWKVEFDEDALLLIEYSEKKEEIVKDIFQIMIGRFEVIEENPLYCRLKAIEENSHKIIALMFIESQIETFVKIQILKIEYNDANTSESISKFFEKESRIRVFKSSEEFGVSSLHHLIKRNPNGAFTICDKFNEVVERNYDTISRNQKDISDMSEEFKDLLGMDQHQDILSEKFITNNAETKDSFEEKKSISEKSQTAGEGDIECNVDQSGKNTFRDDVDKVNFDPKFQSEKALITAGESLIENDKDKETHLKDDERKIAKLFENNDLQILAENCKNFLVDNPYSEILERNYLDWTEIFFDWNLSSSLLHLNKFMKFDPYNGIAELLWDISIDNELLDIIRKYSLNQRIAIIYHVLRARQGYCIFDKEFAYRINEKINDYIIFCIDLTIFRLENIIGFMYSKANRAIQSSYSIVLMGHENNKLRMGEIIENYIQKNKGELEIEDFLKVETKKGIKHMVLIHEDLRYVPFITENPTLTKGQELAEIYIIVEINSKEISDFKLQVVNDNEDIVKDFRECNFKSINPLIKIFKCEVQRNYSKIFYLRLIQKENKFYEGQDVPRKLSLNPQTFLYNVNFKDFKGFWKLTTYTAYVKDVDDLSSMIYYLEFSLGKNVLKSLMASITESITLKQKHSTQAAYQNSSNSNRSFTSEGQNQILHFNYLIEQWIQELDNYKILILIIVASLIPERNFFYQNYQKNQINSAFKSAVEFIFQQNVNLLLLNWKSEIEDHFLVKGMSNLLIVTKNKGDILHLSFIDSIKDFNFASKLIQQIIKFYVYNYLELSESEDNFIKHFIGKLSNPRIKEKIMIEYLKLNLDFMQILKILKLCNENKINISPENLQLPLSRSYTKIKYTTLEIYRMMIEIHNLPTNINIVFNEYYYKFIEKNLMQFKNINIGDIKTYAEIIKFLEENGIQNHMKIEEIIELFIKNLGFFHSLDLILEFRQKMTKFYDYWLSTLKDIEKKLIDKIDKELAQSFGALKNIYPQDDLESLFKKFCELSLIHINSKNYNHQIISLIRHINDCEFEILKNSFKSFLIDKLLNSYNSPDSALMTLQNYKKTNGCEMLDEIIKTIGDFVRPDRGLIRTNILENPSRNHHWNDHLCSIKKSTVLSNEICSYVLNLCQSIISKSISSFDFAIIMNYTDDQKQGFLKYVNIVFDKKKPDFRTDFHEILETEVSKFKILLCYKDYFTNLNNGYLRPTQELTSYSAIIDEWNESFDILDLSSNTIPNELTQLIVLVDEIKYSIDSQFYLYYFKVEFDDIGNFDSSIYDNLDENEKSINEFIDYCYACFKYMKSDLENIFQDFEKRKMEIINKFTEILLLPNSNHEVSKLNQILPEIEGKLEILKQISIFIKKESDIYNFCKAIDETHTLIHLSDSEIIDICKIFLKTFDERNNLSIKYYLDFLNEYEAKIFSNVSEVNWPKIFDLFAGISEAGEVLKFVNDISQEELDHLQEGVSESQEHLALSTENLLEFISVWSFFSEYRDERFSYEQYMRSINQKMSEKYSNICVNLRNSRENLKALIQLHSNLNFQEEAKKKKIAEIFKSSIIVFSKTKKLKFDVKLFIIKGEAGNSEPEDSNSLLELRDRALLNVHIKDSRSELLDNDQDSRIFQSFIELVNTISSTLEALKKLYNSIYREQLNVNFQFFCKEGSFEELQNYNRTIVDEYEKWEKNIEEMTKSHYCLNFLNGKQYHLIEKFLYEKNEQNYSKIVPLFKFLKRELDPNSIIDYEIVHQMEERIALITHFIESFQPIPERPWEEMKINNRIDHHSRSVLICNTTEFYAGILSIYYNTGRGLPTIEKVFFCNINSNWLEVQLFLNRCFLDPSNGLYILVHPENLTLECQINFEIKFHEFFQKNPSLNFYFAIVTKDIKCHLVNHFRYQTEIEKQSVLSHQILDETELTRLMKKINRFTVVYTSTTVGLGKTTEIRKRVIKNKLKYCELNISGNSSTVRISKILSRIKQDQPVALHLQLNMLENSDMVHEIIFSLAVYRQFYSPKGIFYLPNHSKVFIEIANTFENSLMKNFKFLSVLRNYHIERFDIQKVIISNSIKYICSYLECYSTKTIDKKEISFYDPNTWTNLSNSKVITLLQKYFLGYVKNPSYHQLTIFVNLLQKLFRNLENSSYSVEVIKYHIEDMSQIRNNQFIGLYQQIRSHIIESLLETTKEFTSKCLESVRNNQKLSMSQILHGIEENPLINEENQYKASIAWENSNHFTMLFLDQGDSLCIYRNPNIIPNSIKELLSGQKFLEINAKKRNIQNFANYLNKSLEDKSQFIENYSELNSYQLIEKLVNFYARYALKNDFKDSRHRIKQLSESGYVLTSDNFLKMNLIFIRCISNIPLLIMGETGCGKTSLIRFFVQEILRESLKIMCIHSGTTSEIINKEIQEINQTAQEKPDSRHWVLFDEFNTSDCIGMLCDILCEKKIRDIELSPNLIFVGACNPYRVKSSSISYVENVGIKKASKSHASSSKLVHIVKPLPEKAIEYIWDFGVLKKNEIREYVRSMLTTAKCQNIDIFIELICEAHDYFQFNEDISSVSLRDVSRFIDLYGWFENSLQDRKEIPPDQPLDKYLKYQQKIGELAQDNALTAGILSLFHCYFLRISSQDQREAFLDKISKRMNEIGQVLTCDLIKDIIKFEQFDYLSRMKLAEGTALNLALRENIFAIIPCILNRIPVLICGKPGCSKSLAIQLIASNLRGDKSKDRYFKTLPELQIVSFQGSDSCTSEGIEQVFERAKRLKANQYLLPVIVFDEIGLAEISKHNPLKVLHGLLERENREVAFIGISNWRLDASKMNRALYLARPDPNDKDLINTALSIFKSIVVDGELVKDFEKIIKLIAESYYELKNAYKNTDFADFYGLRDFYYLIKQISHKVKFGNQQPEELFPIIRRSIERNFGGKIKAVKIFWKAFCKKFFENDTFSQFKETPVLDLIQENLYEKDSRYLMIITRKDIADYLTDVLLKKELQDPRIFLGSKFSKDVDREDAGFRVLSDIIRYMERGISIVLNDMECAYSSLYDLFNQNFSSSSANRKYCRIALGAQFNPRCFVNENFKVVVFMNEDEESLKRADAPFLNRFEKHYLGLKQIVSEEQIKIVKEIQEWVLKCVEGQKEKVLLDINSFFPCYSEEGLYLMVLCDESDDKVSECKKKLIQAASVDLVLFCEFNKHDEYEKEIIKNIWFEGHQNSIYEELIAMEQQKANNKMMVVTYDEENIDVLLKNSLHNKIVLQQVSNFRSEDDLNKDIKQFFNSHDKTFYILEMDYIEEGVHLRLIINQIENTELESKHSCNEQKYLCLILRMSRNDANRRPLEMYKNWKVMFFEDLKGNNLELLGEIKEFDAKSIIFSENVISFKQIIPYLAETAIDALKYQSSVYDLKEINKFVLVIEKNLVEDDNLQSLFKEKIVSMIEKNNSAIQKKWTLEIFTNKSIISDAKSAKDALMIFIKKYFLSEYTKILFLIEKKSAFYSYIENSLNQEIIEIWKNIFSNLNTSEIGIQVTLRSNPIVYYKELHLPFVLDEFNRVKEIFCECSSVKINNNDTYSTKLAEFKKNYREKSIWKNYLKYFYSNREVQEEVIKDFIKIVLNNAICDYKNLDLFAESFRKILTEDEFEASLFLFFTYKDFILLFQKIFDIHTYLNCNSDLNWALGIIRDIKDNLSQNDIEKKLNEEESSDLENEEKSEGESENFNEIINESEENSQEEDIKIENIIFGNSEVNLYRIIVQLVNQAINTISLSKSLDSIPQKKLLGELQNLETCIESIESFVLNINESTNLWIKNSEKLEFYIQLCRISNTKSLLGKISKIISSKSVNILQNQNFATKLLKEIDEIQINPNNELFIQKFKVYFYFKIIENQQERVFEFSELLNNTEIWKYSLYFIEKIISMSQIKEIIQENESNHEFLEIINQEPNEMLINIEKILEEQGLESKLGIIISDNILKIDYPEQVRSYKLLLQFYIQNVHSEINELKNICKIIALARSRKIIDWYCKILTDDQVNEAVEIQDSFDEISELLKNQDLRIYQIYAYKKIKQLKNCRTAPLINFLKQKNIEWMQEINEVLITTNIEVFPYIFNENQNYIQLCLAIANIEDNINALDEEIFNANSSAKRLLLGLAIMNNVFLKFYTPNYNSGLFINWFNTKSHLILERLGNEFCMLVHNFINNFPPNSLLHLRPDVNRERFLEIQIICFISLITVSYNTNKDALTSIFFNESGKINENLVAHINSIYCIGTEPLKIHDYLRFVLQNFSILKSTTFNTRYSRGGSYVCSRNCDYFYIVNKCGGTTEISQCPFCGNNIGGQNHQHIVREGHNNLNDVEAAQYLESKNKFYSENPKKGYLANECLTVTNVRLMCNRLSFYFVNLLTASSFYTFHKSNIIRNEELEALFGKSAAETAQLLERMILTNFREINNGVSEDPYIWILSCLSKLPTILENHHSKPDSSEIRDQFERVIESEILLKISPLESINTYKQAINSFTKPSDFIELIEELKVPDCMDYQFFRVIEDSSLESMTKSFNFLNKKSEFKVLNYFIEKKEEISNLQFFYPIIALSKYLLEKFSFNISRNEASKFPISNYFKDDATLLALFQNFEPAWENLRIELSIDCHRFDKITLTEDEPISYFLIDDDINGDGKFLTAAVKNLADIQNSVLKSCFEDKINEPTKLHPIISLESNDIISFSIDNFDLIQQCFVNNLEYSLGKQIFYDFERIQRNLLDKIRNKKYINSSNLNYIQYQFELLNTRGRYSGVISEIRNRVPQEKMRYEDLEKLEKFVKGLEKRIVKYPWKDFYSILDKILSFLPNIEIPPQMKIGNIIKEYHITVPEHFKDNQLIENIKINHIVHVYEFVENKCYDMLKGQMSEEYKLSIENEKEVKAQFENMFGILMSKINRKVNEEMQNVIRRIVIRMLTAKLDPNFLIYDYLGNESFWTEDFLTVVDTVIEIFPKSLKLSQAIKLEEILNSINNIKQEIKPQAPTKVTKPPPKSNQRVKF